MALLLHHRLHLEALAARKAMLRGHADAGKLSSRIAETLSVPAPAGELDYCLSFEPLEGGVGIRGEVKAMLLARCQRCLGRMELQLDVPIRLLIPETERNAAPAGWDLGEAGARFTLGEFIEEELLLVMPFAPRHSEGACPTATDTSVHGSG